MFRAADRVDNLVVAPEQQPAALVGRRLARMRDHRIERAAFRTSHFITSNF